MFVEILRSLAIIAASLVILLFWAGTFISVYFDVSQRNLPEGRQFAWLTVVALLPMLGYLIYLLARRLSATSWMARRKPIEVPSLHDNPRSNTQPMPRPVEPQPVRVPLTGGTVSHIPVTPERLPPRAETRPVLLKGKGQGLEATPPAGSHSGGQAGSYHKPRPAIHLRVVYGPNGSERFRLDTLPASIGRGPQAKIALDDDLEVSRQHAEIYDDQGELRIRDLNSRHGTFINGLAVDDASLNPGDQIWVGASLLQVEG